MKLKTLLGLIRQYAYYEKLTGWYERHMQAAKVASDAGDYQQSEDELSRLNDRAKKTYKRIREALKEGVE